MTELFNLPLRTGIQRVERELIRHWPGPARLVLCVYDPAIDDLVILPDAATSIFTAPPDTFHLTVAEERAALRALLSEMPHPVPADGNRIINAELFFNMGRAQFYERLARSGSRRIFWLVYDFLPYLRLEWFEQGTGRNVMPYLRALRSIANVAFISEHTRQDYLRRVMRDSSRDGPVVALGGDGIGLERQTFSPVRDSYVVLGSIEPRKRVAAVLDAFAQLWSEGSQARLIVIGRLIAHAKREIALIDAMEHTPLFTHLVAASDAAICEALRGARAMIFASEAEGFGLPPFEALYCGVPVIVGPNVPSIEMLSPDGQIRIDRVEPELIAAAVRKMQDDAVAESLWDETKRLHIPSWRDFASSIATWGEAA